MIKAVDDVGLHGRQFRGGRSLLAFALVAALLLGWVAVGPYESSSSTPAPASPAKTVEAHSASPLRSAPSPFRAFDQDGAQQPRSAATEAQAVGNATAGWGICRRGMAPIRNGAKFVDVDDVDLSTTKSFGCPLLYGKGVPTCEAIPPDATRKVNVDGVAQFITAVRTKQRNKAIEALRGACDWPTPRVGEGTEAWEPGDAGRRLIGSMQEAFDCNPPGQIAATAHHLPGSIKHLRGSSQAYNLHHRLLGRLRVPIPVIPSTGKTAAPSTHSYPSLVVPSSVAYRTQGFQAEAKYSRPRKSGWIRLDNVCMTCETGHREFFMNPKRRCQLTLWSIGSILLGIESKSRQGRHSIYKEREGGFQFGGQRHPADTAGALVMRGTTFFDTSFAVDNVGHVIRDAVWSFHVSGLVRRKGKFSEPYHMMIDGDFFNASSNYYAFTTLASGLRLFRGDGVDESIDAGELNQPRVASGGTPPILLNPVSAGVEKMVCFESVVFAGRDRGGHNGGYVNKAEVAANLRSEVLSFLNLDPIVVSGEIRRIPRVYIYGRQEVHRRHLDNLGQLTAALAEVTHALDAPPPTVITTFYMEPARQIELMAGIDILVSIQGAHLEQHLFMPLDAVIIEIAACHSTQTSFVSRYGTYHPKQKFKQMRLCHPLINFSDRDKRAQDLLLCPHHLRQLQDDVRGALKELLRSRKMP
jgi:hypothetical protein